MRTGSTNDLLVLTALRVLQDGRGIEAVPATSLAETVHLTTQATVRALHKLRSAGRVACTMARWQHRKRLCWSLTPAGFEATDKTSKGRDNDR